MAVRGVYTKVEQEMLEKAYQSPFMKAGWAKLRTKAVATEESVRSFAMAIDPWNPLWSNESYCANTRWGGIIAAPMYVARFMGGGLNLAAPPEVGYHGGNYIGEDWEFFHPVRPGDTFRMWHRPSVLEDITPLDGKGYRTFRLIPQDYDYINQKDELVCRYKVLLDDVYQPDPLNRTVMAESRYKYTEAELDFIDQISNQEEIRGSEVRYWEDVNVGEAIKLIAASPTSISDIANFVTGSMGGGMPATKGTGRGGPMSQRNPETGAYFHGAEHHFSDDAAKLSGVSHAFRFGAYARHMMARLVTNWMGDDGILRKYYWRHMTVSPIGDSIIGRGKVAKKYIENGEHLVDIQVWLDNLRGNVSEAAVATVSLCTKETPTPYQWK